ncbi:MAG: RimK/LysX family protein [Acidobacteriota bacterium]
MNTAEPATEDRGLEPDVDHASRKTIVGWRELVDLPEWQLFHIAAKIDTGARTSALHVEELEEHEGLARFSVPLEGGGVLRSVSIEAAVTRRSLVRPSTGELQERLVVSTALRLAGIEQEVEVSLVSRAEMLAPMLIGRRSLGTRFLVNPRRRYLHGRPE